MKVKNGIWFTIFIFYALGGSAQVYNGVYKSTSTNTDYHHFIRNGSGSAVYINQVSTNGAHPILRLSSGTFAANSVDNVRLTVENNGNVGIGTTNPAAKLDVDGNMQSKGIVLVDATYGSNSDYTALYREDTGSDNSTVKFRIGDDALGSFQLGYKSWQTGEWISTFYVNNYGRVGIGSTTPDSKLTVKGKVHAEEVKVDLSVPGPDYVFKEGYNLRSLEEVQNYIEQNGHLPNIPSAEEMETDGVELGIMNMKLLEKIEELTLYILEQEKKMENQSKEIEKLQNLENRVLILESKK